MGSLDFKLSSLLPAAAAVLDVGMSVQSPIAKTFGYLVLCPVSLFTATNPDGPANGLDLMTSGGPIGGGTCIISYWIMRNM